MEENAQVGSYRAQAEKGDATAQFNLGICYANGEGVEKDDVEAIKWYRKAADQGLATAQCQLGWIYGAGRGVDKDQVEAVNWYRKAAEQGHALAQSNLGVMYENGSGVQQDQTEAVKWYRMSAKQGNENAKKHLVRLKIKEEETTPCSRKDSSKQRISKKKKTTVLQQSPKSGDQARELSKCIPLLDISTPAIYSCNAFRITGLLVDATSREIKRRMDDLKSSLEMGDIEDDICHSFALETPPSMEMLREAAQRLQDPEQRIIDEFFWFWPEEWGNAKKDTALIALQKGDKNTAFKIWMEYLSDARSPASVVAKHNLAVMYQLVALDSEQHALNSKLEKDQLDMIAEYWRTCFKWWEELTGDETFWSLLADRIRMIDDPRLTTGFARRMRATLPEAMDKINAMLALSFIEKEKHQLAKKHIDYMLETHQGQDNVAATMALVTTPLLNRIKAIVDQTEQTCVSDPLTANLAASNLLQIIADPIRILKHFLPANNYQLIDVCDTIANTCLKCQRAYARETEDWQGCVQILEEAKHIAISDDTTNEIGAALKIVSNNLAYSTYGEPIIERLKELESVSDYAKRFKIVEKKIIPELKNLKSGKSGADAYHICADIIAAFLRNLSVSAYNETSDIALANRAIVLALSIVADPELCNRLKEDQKQITKLEQEAHDHDLKLEIRSDTIQIDRSGIRYNDQYIAVNNLYGIKFGAFVQYTNGSQTSCSYRVDYRSRDGTVINIECKRMLRSEAKAQADFQAILDATIHQLVSRLIASVAKDIAAGNDYEMGNDCVMTHAGVKFTTGALMWKKEHLIPFQKVLYNTHQGVLSLSSSVDATSKTSLSLRDNWNAVFFELIAKAILENTIE